MKLKKAMILFGTVCILNTMVAGCGSGSESAAKTEETQVEEASPEEFNNAPRKDVDGSAEEAQENTAGKWQVLEPDVASAVDADFLGKVWKMEEDSFFIVEREVKILDDGSSVYSSPSSDADIPDSQLIHVVFEEDTRFYLKDTDENGEGHENKEAEPLDTARFLGFRGAEYHADGFLFGVADESAGVDYHRLGVRAVAVPEYFVARRRQPRHQMFAVDRVLGAAKSNNINLFHGRTER